LCYTIKINLTREQIEKRFRAVMQQPDLFVAGDKISAFSLPRVPVICSDNAEEIRLYIWGLIPFWVKDPVVANEIRRKTFNAKAETLADKPSYRNSLNSKRCLVIVNGFYEWQTTEKKKIPYLMSLKEQPIFALAGLYDTWKNPANNEILKTFTIITTRANPKMEEIHNLKKRMPVILSPEEEKKWLSSGLTENEIKKIFEPFPQELMIFDKIEKN
jgi:putative SOS response-associated peptidase YedK